MNRLDCCLAALRQRGRPGLVTYVTAGDPDFATSVALLARLGASGADIIELGMPFSDPVADGPVIQQAHQRALANGQTMAKTLAMVAQLRKYDAQTPVVLMGYLNPVMQYGVDLFMQEAAQSGVDGLLLVDLPVEHAATYREAARAHGILLIAMTAPGSDEARLQRVLADAAGFVYHVSINGITGATGKTAAELAPTVARIRRHTPLPVALGFGIREVAQLAALRHSADLLVVGSALVAMLAESGAEAALARVSQMAAVLKNEG